MSYEGFYELLCERGHYTAHDAYESQPKNCPRCGGSWKWRHSVDRTNGHIEGCPGTYPAPKAITGAEDDWNNDHYGNRFAKEVRRYEPAPGSDWQRLGRKARHA